MATSSPKYPGWKVVLLHAFIEYSISAVRQGYYSNPCIIVWFQGIAGMPFRVVFILRVCLGWKEPIPFHRRGN